MKGLHDSLSFSLFQWVLISIRALMFFSVLCVNYVIQKLIGLIVTQSIHLFSRRCFPFRFGRGT